MFRSEAGRQKQNFASWERTRIAGTHHEQPRHVFHSPHEPQNFSRTMVEPASKAAERKREAVWQTACFARCYWPLHERLMLRATTDRAATRHDRAWTTVVSSAVHACSYAFSIASYGTAIRHSQQRPCPLYPPRRAHTRQSKLRSYRPCQCLQTPRKPKPQPSMACRVVQKLQGSTSTWAIGIGVGELFFFSKCLSRKSLAHVSLLARLARLRAAATATILPQRRRRAGTDSERGMASNAVLSLTNNVDHRKCRQTTQSCFGTHDSLKTRRTCLHKVDSVQWVSRRKSMR